MIPVDDLIGMKLTSYRLEDQMHIKDLDEAGVITPEIEAKLSPVQRERLRQTRARQVESRMPNPVVQFAESDAG